VIARSRWTQVIAVAAACGALVVVAIWRTHSADAGKAPWVPVSAPDNIAALNQPAALSTPAAAAQLGAPPRETRNLGVGGRIWANGSAGVCVLLRSGAGGCFQQFTKPVVLFMTGETAADGRQLSATAEGVVADAVAAARVVMADGTKIDTNIVANGFEVGLPPGVAITGVEVTLRNRTLFVSDDALRPFAPPPG